MVAAAQRGPTAGVGESLRRDPSPPAILPLNEIERLAILDMLDHTKGELGRAAQRLGIGRTTLYRKLKEYRLGDRLAAIGAIRGFPVLLVPASAAPEPKAMVSAGPAVASKAVAD
jgi:hypothetical protein